MKTKGLVLTAALLLVSSVAALAHHSFDAEYDRSKPITLKGKVTKVEWMNPHIYTHVEVKDADGTLKVYRVEGGAPNTLFRQGWRKDTLKIGQPLRLHVTFVPICATSTSTQWPLAAPARR